MQSFQDQLFKLKTEQSEEKAVMENQYKLHMKEKSEMENNLAQTKRKHEKTLQHYFKTFLQLESKLNNQLKLLDAYSAKGQENQQSIIQRIKV